MRPGPSWWRVGHARDPLRPPPPHLYAWNHRFDPGDRASRTLYVAQSPETCLREVLSDLRPNTEAISRYVARFGPSAAGDVPAEPVTAAWRTQNVLVGVEVDLDGPAVDLLDSAVLADLEVRHAALLLEHGFQHLDLSAISARQRVITQTIAADLHARTGTAAIRFPSRHDGVSCLAIFAGRGELRVSGTHVVALTDPPDPALHAVSVDWSLELEPAPSP